MRTCAIPRVAKIIGQGNEVYLFGRQSAGPQTGWYENIKVSNSQFIKLHQKTPYYDKAGRLTSRRNRHFFVTFYFWLAMVKNSSHKYQNTKVSKYLFYIGQRLFPLILSFVPF